MGINASAGGESGLVKRKDAKTQRNHKEVGKRPEALALRALALILPFVFPLCLCVFVFDLLFY
jgi:hypothetical protein